MIDHFRHRRAPRDRPSPVTRKARLMINHSRQIAGTGRAADPSPRHRGAGHRNARRLHLSERHSRAVVPIGRAREHAGAAASADPAQAAAVDKVVQDAIKARHLRAVIVRVTDRRQGDHHQGLRRVDDRRARHGRHALPQRRRRHLLRLHAAAHARRREEGEPRRQGLEMGSGDPPQRRGHPRSARPDDHRLHRLRDRQRRSRRHAATPTRSASGPPRSCSRPSRRSRCCTRRARTGTTPTPTT